MAIRMMIVVGSTYEFNLAGVEDVIELFKSEYPDKNSAPFVVYNARQQVFLAEVEEDMAIPQLYLLKAISTYLDQFQAPRSHLEHEVCVCPMEGTFLVDIATNYAMDNLHLLVDECVDADSDTEADDDQVLEHELAFWKPKNVDIDILPDTITREISELTGSLLVNESAQKRVRILHGDFKAAQRKLRNMEPLLSALQFLATGQPVQANSNIILPNTQPQESRRIEFVRISEHPTASLRIVVDEKERTLEKKAVGEIRLRDKNSLEWAIPENLQLSHISPTEIIGPSQIWRHYHFEGVGDPFNIQHMIPPSSRLEQSTESLQQPRSLAKERLDKFLEAVVSKADPNMPLEDEGKPMSATRRVVLDSDSDEDYDELGESTNRRSSALNTNVRHQLISSNIPTELESYERLDDSVTPNQGGSNSALNAAIKTSERVRQQSTDEPGGTSPWKSQVVDANPLTTFETWEEPTSTIDISTNLTLSPCQLSVSRSKETLPVFAPPLGSNHSDANLSKRTSTESWSQSICSGSRHGTHRAFESEPDASHLRASYSQESESCRSKRYSYGEPGCHGHGRYRSQLSIQQNPTPGDLSPDSPHNRPYSGYQSFCQGLRQRDKDFQASSTLENLVDIEPSIPNTSNPTIPPGLEVRVPLVKAPQQHRHDFSNSVPAQVYYPASDVASDILSSASDPAKLSRFHLSTEGSDYINTSPIQKRDVSKMAAQRLAELLAKRAAREAAGASLTEPGNEQAEADNNKVAECPASPIFHSTMQQQANDLKRESRAEAKLRRQKVIQEAYGDLQPSTAKAMPQSSKSNTSQENPAKKTKLRGAMKHNQREEKAQALEDHQVGKLREKLLPIFENARAFRGHLYFEMQLGQVLVSFPSGALEDGLHDQTSWQAMFDTPGRPPQVPTTFSRIVTQNGADVDRALEVCLAGGSQDLNSRLWSKLPGPSSMVYEFHCQSLTDQEFILRFNSTGNYDLHHGPATLGMVNMHFPDQVWDACAALTGVCEWKDPPKNLVKSVISLVGSIHIPSGKDCVTIYFRNSHPYFRIKHLVLKRESLHACTARGYETIFLKLKEVRSLLMCVDEYDPELCFGYEGDANKYHSLIDDERIYYEMAIIADEINDGLRMNKSLELGETTDTDTANLLERSRLQKMLKLTCHMVRNIDFMGMHNVGTLQRQQAHELELQQYLQEVTRLRPGECMDSQSVIQPAHSRMSDPQTTNSSISEVPGIRVNTMAEERQIEGVRVRIGIGGAVIPAPAQSDCDKRAPSIRWDRRDTAPSEDRESTAGSGTQWRHAPQHSAWSERGPGFW